MFTFTFTMPAGIVTMVNHCLLELKRVMWSYLSAAVVQDALLSFS